MFISPAFAQGSLFGGGLGGDSGMLMSLLPFVLIFVIMYFLILRPQQKRVKQHNEMVKNVRRGDTVVTNGGLIGKVTKVIDDDQIEIEIADEVRSVLATTSTLVLATADTEGIVSSAPLFFVFDPELRLYWLSSADSRHSRNLALRPQAAVSVYPAVWNWTEIRGAQLEGTGSPVADAGERDRVVGEYIARFHLPAELSGAIAKSTLYRFVPAWIRYVTAFGERAEFRV